MYNNNANGNPFVSLPSPTAFIIGTGHHKKHTPLPADPIDPNFQYTISPSKSLNNFSNNNVKVKAYGVKGKNTLNDNNYVKQNTNM